jgi:hypothetical protein
MWRIRRFNRRSRKEDELFGSEAFVAHADAAA